MKSPNGPGIPVSGSSFDMPRGAAVLISAYIAAQMLSDVASLKIGLVFGFAVDMGTFIYPITFTLRDLVHKRLGKRAARTLIVAAGAVNVFMALYLAWAAAVPGDPSWGLQKEFAGIFMPVYRLVLASIVAEIVSELMDTEAYHWFVTRVTTRFQWLRVLVSNAVSVPIDNLIFAFGAFAFALPWEAVIQIFLFNLAVKLLVTLAGLPLIYAVPDKREYGRDGR